MVHINLDNLGSSRDKHMREWRQSQAGMRAQRGRLLDVQRRLCVHQRLSPTGPTGGLLKRGTFAATDNTIRDKHVVVADVQGVVNELVDTH
jgi:hypothetical protein